MKKIDVWIPPEGWYDLSTLDGRRRAFNDLEQCALPDQLKAVLLQAIKDGKFPTRKGAPPKPQWKRLRDAMRALALKNEHGISTADAGERDRAYRPNRKRSGKK